MEYIHLSPMRRRILDLFQPRFVENDVVNMIKTIYSDIPDRIYSDDMDDEDFYLFGIFLMGISTALLAVDNDKVSREYARECRILRKDIIATIECIMIETDMD